MLKAGRVGVNGRVVQEAGEKCDSEVDRITVDGREVRIYGKVYLMMNKPCGYISATEDRSKATVIDLLGGEYGKMGLHPVGRLDRDTEGLIILTNDGEFTHRVTSPGSGIKKLYRVEAEDEFTEADKRRFKEGVVLGDGTRCRTAELEIDEAEARKARITVTEGKYHQVKRMVSSCGNRVTRLKREAIGGLELDKGLKPGEYRELSEEEVELVYEG